MKFITFGKPCYGEKEISEVVKVLNSRWIGTGKKTILFEKEFNKYKKSKYSIAVNSCTAALHLSLLALGIKKGDEVITTPLTFCSTVNTILHVGARPVLAEIDKNSLNIKPENIEKKITKKTKAIIVVHFAGLCCEMEKILKIAKKYSLKLIEDCAHSVESKYKNKTSGTFGDTGCFSFYSTKNLTTGEGGMITTQSDKTSEICKSLRLHGLSLDAWKRYNTKGKYKQYLIKYPGYKYNLTNIAAALGIQQLKNIEKNWKKRKKIWDYYNKNLTGLPLILPPRITKEYKHSYHLYTIVIDWKKTKIKREKILNYLQKNNIGVGIHYETIQNYKFYKDKVKFNKKELKFSSLVGKNIFSIPLYPCLSFQHQKYIVNKIKNFFNV